MDNDNIKVLISIRTKMVEMYGQLDAKNEPHGVIKQSHVARDLEIMIRKIDKILKDKVKFT